MSVSMTEPDYNAINFPPLPIFSGTVLATGGEGRHITNATVTLTCADGTIHTVDLVQAWGGYWHPDRVPAG